MQVIASTLLLFFCVLAKAAIETDNGVLVITDGNFNEASLAHPQMLLEFYAPWCGHCKKLAPEWEKAAKKLGADDVSIKLAKVDATENKKLASDHDIKGFPTIKYFNNGKVSEYNGGRVESEIVSWVMKKSGPAYATVTTEEDIMKLEEKHDSFNLGIFSSLSSAAAKDFISRAQSDDIYAYAISVEAAIKNKFNVEGEAIIVIKNFDDLRSDLALPASEDKVSSFIQGANTPVIQEFNDANQKKIFGSSIQKHVLIFTDKESSHHDATLAEFKAAAPDSSGEVMMVNVPAKEDRVMDFFGITEADLPKMVIGDMSEGAIKKFFYDGEMKSGEISSFIADFLANKLKPTLKSEEPALDDTTGDVVVVKGKTFNDIVLESGKDVLVEFYAPWCGHCKKLEPIYNELGAKYKNNENIVIAKMDSTANEIDVDGVNVKGFPTLLFFKAGEKLPIDYEGARDLDGMSSFIAKNAKNPTPEHSEL